MENQSIDGFTGVGAWNNDTGNVSALNTSEYLYNGEDMIKDYYDISYRVSTMMFNPHIILVLILGSIAVIANFSTILAVLKIRSRWTGLFRFMLSLMLSDILVATSAILYVLNRVLNPEYMTGYGPYGARLKAKCIPEIIKALHTSGLNITLLNLMGMALDHYVAILSPLRYYRIFNSKKTNIFIITLWSVAFLSGFSDFYSPLWDMTQYRELMNRNFNYCEYIYISSYNEEYTTFVIAFVCYIVMLNVYLRIYCKVKTKRRGSVVDYNYVNASRNPTSFYRCLKYCLQRKDNITTKTTCTRNDDQLNKVNKVVNDEQDDKFINEIYSPEEDDINILKFSSSRGRSKTRNTRALYTTLLILGTFIICWLPSCGFQISMLIIKRVFKGTTISFSFYTQLLNVDHSLYVILLLNTICDPLIYAVRIQEVRQGFRSLGSQIWQKCCCHCKVPGSVHVNKPIHSSSTYTATFDAVTTSEDNRRKSVTTST